MQQQPWLPQRARITSSLQHRSDKWGALRSDKYLTVVSSNPQQDTVRPAETRLDGVFTAGPRRIDIQIGKFFVHLESDDKLESSRYMAMRKRRRTLPVLLTLLVRLSCDAGSWDNMPGIDPPVAYL
jgi:hypothetical protein